VLRPVDIHEQANLMQRPPAEPPHAGFLALEFSSFAVDARPDLAMVISNPATPTDAGNIR